MPPEARYDRDWEVFIRRVVRRYSAAVGIEVWNEQNNGGTPNFFYPRPRLARYMRLLREAYRTSKAARPRLPVVSGGLAPYTSTTGGGQIIGATEALRTMYRLGLARISDAVAYHTYPDAVPLVPSVLREIRDVRRIMCQARDCRKPLWITEVGLGTVAGSFAPFRLVSEAEQAADLVQILQGLGNAGVPVVVFHRMIDVPGDGTGLLRSDGSPKPAYCAFGRELGRPCPR